MLGEFYHRLACRLTGRQPRRGRDEAWIYPLLEYAMVEAGLQEVETYDSCRQNMVAQFILTRLIMNLCLAAEWRQGPRMSKRWWEQDGVNVEGVRTADWEAERTDGVGGDGQDGYGDGLNQ